MVERTAMGKVMMPIGDARVECLWVRFAGVRTAHQPYIGGEYTVVAVPFENVLDLVAELVANASWFFPDQMRGVRLVRNRDDLGADSTSP
ncbi:MULTISPECIES: hypothetical protein [unclassified Nocardia]|uniref:hypothetical protein n=1 Tax=unclassified Nocardia TaxID=2637762 RepID=UPI001CE3FA35|nr:MULTISPECIES: hypothetical protein [unclassified Nocardia]